MPAVVVCVVFVVVVVVVVVVGGGLVLHLDIVPADHVDGFNPRSGR
jgi:hypothetical protein